MLETLYSQFDHVLVLDTETTGINHKQDEIIELSAVFADKNGISREMDHLIRLSPGRELPPVITELTGITPADLALEGVEKSAAAQELAALLRHEKLLLVAYNAQFDLCFLFYFLQRLGLADALKGIKMLDALTVYKDRRPYPHKLKDAIAAYGLDAKNSHRALDDTRATYLLLQAMAQEKDDLHRYINLFGYNPKYGVSGPRISSLQYRPQGYDRSCPLYEMKSGPPV